MKSLRRICICLIALGCTILSVPRGPSVDTVPFPGKGLSVKLNATLRSEGDYRLDVAMPKKDQSEVLASEVIPCSLSVIISRSGKSVLQAEVKTLSLYSEFGWAGIQYFKSQNWHLGRGEYEVEVKSYGDCPAAVARGAALSLEQEQSDITERFLADSFLNDAGIIFVLTGLVGLVLCEIKKT